MSGKSKQNTKLGKYDGNDMAWHVPRGCGTLCHVILLFLGQCGEEKTARFARTVHVKVDVTTLFEAKEAFNTSE
jgi:hypothetical protein